MKGVRNWMVRAGWAGGAALCAAAFGTTGASVAHADNWDLGDDALSAGAVLPIVTSDPQDLLTDASTNVTDANQVLAQGTTDILGLNLQPDIQDHALSILSSLSTAETSLASYDGGAFADALNPWFNTVDEGLDQATAALLNADKAVESAIAAGSGVDPALFAVFGADLQLAGDFFNALPIEFVDGFIDPSMFTNVF